MSWKEWSDVKPTKRPEKEFRAVLTVEYENHRDDPDKPTWKAKIERWKGYTAWDRMTKHWFNTGRWTTEYTLVEDDTAEPRRWSYPGNIAHYTFYNAEDADEAELLAMEILELHTKRVNGKRNRDNPMREVYL